MDAPKENRGRQDAPRASRRRFLTALAAGVGSLLAGPGSAQGRPIDPEGGPGIPRRTMASPETPPETDPTTNADLPWRPRSAAIKDCVLRRELAERRAATQTTPLGALLARTSLAESRIGLANWHLMEEAEDLNLGHFTFPISPFTTTVDDGRQRFLLLSNTNIIGNFRYLDYLEHIQRRMFDRAVWAMAGGRAGTATIEFDRGLGSLKTEHIVRLLNTHGVRTIIWGNETNSPYAPWRDDLSALFEIFMDADATRKRYGITDTDLSLPGLAYYGQGEYIQKMARTFKDLLARRGHTNFAASFPVQRLADHYYGPVEQFLPRIRMMKDVMAREGLSFLKYDMTEVGNPTMEPGAPKASDEQLAECHIPQICSIAVGSGLVDRFYYFSLLGVTYDDSLTNVENGRLVKRPSYNAFVNLAKLLSRIDKLSLVEEPNTMLLDGTRTDGLGFTIVWSKVSDREVTRDLPAGRRVFDAFGNEIKETRPNQFTLKPKAHPMLAGPARIIVFQR